MSAMKDTALTRFVPLPYDAALSCDDEAGLARQSRTTTLGGLFFFFQLAEQCGTAELEVRDVR